MPFTHLLTNGVIWLIMLITEDKLPIFSWICHFWHTFFQMPDVDPQSWEWFLKLCHEDSCDSFPRAYGLCLSLLFSVADVVSVCIQEVKKALKWLNVMTWRAGCSIWSLEVEEFFLLNSISFTIVSFQFNYKKSWPTKLLIIVPY